MEYPGAVYHVMARGNQGRRVVQDDGDRKMWIATLCEAWRRTGWRIHAWVLMDNHYHLLLETPEGNLVSGMKWLQGTYTQRYNARHRLRGHLFQGRYRAIPVETEEPMYWQRVSTYIHLNPARANLIRIGEEKLREYRWSSYPNYVRVNAPEWLVRERVLGSLGMGPQERRGYEVHMESRALELGRTAGRRGWEAAGKELRGGWYVGGEGFGERPLARARGVRAGGGVEAHTGAGRAAHGQSPAEGMMEEGLRALGLRKEELGKSPKGQLEKQVLAWWVYGHTTVSRRWVAEKLGMGHESAVSQAVRHVERSTAGRARSLKEKLNTLTGEITPR